MASIWYSKIHVSSLEFLYSTETIHTWGGCEHLENSMHNLLFLEVFSQATLYLALPPKLGICDSSEATSPLYTLSQAPAPNISRSSSQHIIKHQLPTYVQAPAPNIFCSSQHILKLQLPTYYEAPAPNIFWSSQHILKLQLPTYSEAPAPNIFSTSSSQLPTYTS